MTTSDAGLSILDRVPVDRINAEAKQLHLGRALLTALAGLLYLIGWTLARVATYAWIAITWSVAAVKLGAQDGWKLPDRERPDLR